MPIPVPPYLVWLLLRLAAVREVHNALVFTPHRGCEFNGLINHYLASLSFITAKLLVVLSV